MAEAKSELLIKHGGTGMSLRSIVYWLFNLGQALKFRLMKLRNRIAFACVAIAAMSATTFADSQPNILFVLTDDQGCSSLKCYGGTGVNTPNIDRLAANGIRFTDAYVTPQCTPTRASLLTGQHSARNGMWHVIPWYGNPYAAVEEPMFREELLPKQCRLPRALRDAGYTTGMSGKWHLTHNRRQGFYSCLEVEAGPEFGFDHVGSPGKGSQNEGDKWVNHLTEDAIKFIRNNRGRPWFYYLSHHTLHGVVTAPEPLIQKYRDLGAPKLGHGNATYLAAVEHLDTSVGRLIRTLEETGQRENTIVVFLADNGGVDTRYENKNPDGSSLATDKPLMIKDKQLENFPLREGKGSMYEGGIRVPCIVSWPKTIPQGTVSSQPIHVVDWFPTLLEAAGTNPEPKEDGLSLLPLFRGESLPERSLYWYMPLYDLLWASTPSAVVRSGDWKLVEFFGDWYDKDKNYHPGSRLELYNLKNDLSETRDLSQLHPKRVVRMQRELHDWINDCGATIPGSNPHYDRARSTLTTRDKPEHLRGKTYHKKQKPRVIITTDINAGSGDPDDRQSLCHVLWYANDFDIRAIIPDRFSPTAIDACTMAFDLYDKDFHAKGNRFRTLGYPSSATFRKQTLVTERSAAIKRIIEEAHRDDERPLWVLVWGNMKLIGDALKADPKIADKLRLITIGTNVKAKESGGNGTKINWNGAGRQYVFDNFPNMWWLESDWTYNGMFHGPEAIQLKEDLAACGGNLGLHISDVIDTVPWADNFRAGDTPTVLYMIDPGHDLNNPAESSWAGRYVKPFPKARPNYWTGITGGHDWNYANPRATWSNASEVYQARAKTLADQRSEMYEALLRRVQTIYDTTDYKRPDLRGNLPAFVPPQSLIVEAEAAKHSGLQIGQDTGAQGSQYLNLNDSGWIVWRFYFDGEPSEYPASIRYRLPSGDKQQTLFINGAKIGNVKFAGRPQAWLTHKFFAHLEKGPNSIVLRKADGGIHIDSLEIGRGVKAK